jgi:hypothetical protein
MASLDDLVALPQLSRVKDAWKYADEDERSGQIKTAAFL